MKVAVFNNINDTSEPRYSEVSKILDSIKNGFFKDKIEAIRNENDKGTQSRLKSSLTSILFLLQSKRVLIQVEIIRFLGEQIKVL